LRKEIKLTERKH